LISQNEGLNDRGEEGGEGEGWPEPLVQGKFCGIGETKAEEMAGVVVEWREKKKNFFFNFIRHNLMIMPLNI